MRLNVFRKITYIAIATLVLAGSLSASNSGALPALTLPKGETNCWDFKAEASDLLREIQARSGELKADAGTLKTFTWGSQLSWQTHASQLRLIRDHINMMGDRLERLQAISHVAAPWQQQAISRIVPIGVDLASHTEAAFKHLNENRGYLFSPAYTGHLAAISDRADDMKDWVDTFLDLPRIQQELDRLQSKIAETQA